MLLTGAGRYTGADNEECEKSAMTQGKSIQSCMKEESPEWLGYRPNERMGYTVVNHNGRRSSVERKASLASLQCCSPLASSIEKQR